jgi:hypothetical protein
LPSPNGNHFHLIAVAFLEHWYKDIEQSCVLYTRCGSKDNFFLGGCGLGSGQSRKSYDRSEQEEKDSSWHTASLYIAREWLPGRQREVNKEGIFLTVWVCLWYFLLVFSNIEINA